MAGVLGVDKVEELERQEGVAQPKKKKTLRKRTKRRKVRRKCSSIKRRIDESNKPKAPQQPNTLENSLVPKHWTIFKNPKIHDNG